MIIKTNLDKPHSQRSVSALFSARLFSLCLVTFLLTTTFIAVAELPAASTNNQLSLSACYELALKNSDTLRARAEDIRAAEARYRQAVAAAYPKLDLLAEQRLRNSSSFGRSSSSSNSNNSNSSHPFVSFLSLQQPIFTGFREELLAEAAQAEIKSLDLTRKRVNEQLFLDVAESYVQIQLYQSDLVILRETERILKNRITELKKFISLGKSRESEVLSANSDIAELQTTMRQIDGLKSATEEMLAFLVGLPASELHVQATISLQEILPLESYLEKGLNRNDLLAIAKQQEALRLKQTAIKRESWPELSLEGNLYPYEDPNQNRDFELLLKLELPIYEGGARQARVDELEANVLSSSHSLANLKRSVERDIRVAYQKYLSAISERESLENLLLSAKNNLASQQNDYALGVVTNLEVLQAIRQVQDAKRRLLQVEAERAIDRIQLKAAAGDIP